MTEDSVRQAQAAFDAGNFRRCRELALRGLQEHPDDPHLLRLAGGSSLELGLDDAGDYLRRAVALSPDDGDAWRDLGLFLMQEGERSGAAEAFRQVVRLRPDDATALVDLGHTIYALGQTDEAIACLAEASRRRPGDLGARRSLVEMYRSANQFRPAFDIAQQITEQQPHDVGALLDIADLHLELGELDEAVAAYGQVRRFDSAPGHEVYVYHGMIQAEMRREQWRRALDLALDASAIDRYDLTTQVLAFIAVELFGRSDHPAPSRTEVEAALASERSEHRRLHTEALTAWLSPG